MSSSFQKAREIFRIDDYKKLNEKKDLSLFKFLLDRSNTCSWLLHLTGGNFFKRNSNNSELAEEMRSCLTAFREDDADYRKLKSFDIRDYVSLEQYAEEPIDSSTWTPAWLRSQKYSCSSVKPMGVGDVIRMFDDLGDGAPKGFTDEEFAEDVAESRARYHRNEEVFPELEDISIDQYYREAYDYHHGLAALNIDLMARDEQIVSELKELLPKLRKLLQAAPERLLDPGFKGQLFLGPSLQKRDTRRIDMNKVRDYRVPALIDLYIWSVVEGESLSNADYLRLVFPGDTLTDELVNEDKIKKVCLPYAFRCMETELLTALHRSLDWEQKSHWKNSAS
ncbi:DUF6387 family protein [Microbulbifer sp. CnH-101-G]|uniref:DUF6387 family protein n=1 Tax=Microbulbifer sp. CnH-101-G TaxID=3243393 RepID=UPI004038FE23